MPAEAGLVARRESVSPPVSVQDHHLLWALGPHTAVAALEARRLPPEAEALYRAVAVAERPRTAAEWAALLRLPRTVVAFLATELVRAGLLQPSQAVAMPASVLAPRLLRGLGEPTEAARDTVKVIVVGLPGSGKTSFLKALCGEPPARCEEAVIAPQGADEGQLPSGAAGWVSVVVEAGRLTLADGLVVVLASHPGRAGCEFMWDDLAREAAGAIMLVQPHRLEQAGGQVRLLKQRHLPFVLALTTPCVPASQPEVEKARHRLDLPAAVPLLAGDVGDPAHARQVLGALARSLADLGASVPMGATPHRVLFDLQER